MRHKRTVPSQEILDTSLSLNDVSAKSPYLFTLEIGRRSTAVKGTPRQDTEPLSEKELLCLMGGVITIVAGGTDW